MQVHSPKIRGFAKIEVTPDHPSHSPLMDGVLQPISGDFGIPQFNKRLTWYFIGKWLQNFEYRINIHFTAFLIAGMGSIIIAWLTVGYLSYRAATANPVNTLREE